tara:strand:+ start:508 stop:939 length:432 start_codon:yes stop_codon:yes gene_type:complete
MISFSKKTLQTENIEYLTNKKNKKKKNKKQLLHHTNYDTKSYKYDKNKSKTKRETKKSKKQLTETTSTSSSTSSATSSTDFVPLTEAVQQTINNRIKSVDYKTSIENVPSTELAAMKRVYSKFGAAGLGMRPVTSLSNISVNE